MDLEHIQHRVNDSLVAKFGNKYGRYCINDRRIFVLLTEILGAQRKYFWISSTPQQSVDRSTKTERVIGVGQFQEALLKVGTSLFDTIKSHMHFCSGERRFIQQKFDRIKSVF